MHGQSSRPCKWWVLVSVGISTFMSALDGSVVNTILPVVSHDYQSPMAHVEWVITVYLLVISSLLLGFGKLGDMRGHKPVYLTGCGILATARIDAMVLGVGLTGAVFRATSRPLAPEGHPIA